jgi:hypothetical protein
VQDYQFALAMVESFEIKYEKGKILSYTVNFKSKKGATATLTATYTAENAFLPQHLVFKLATNLAGLAAASAINIKSLSIKIEKGLELDEVLGAVDPVDICNKEFKVSGSVEALFEDEAAFKTIALGDTAKAMRIDLIHTVTIGASSFPELKIDLAKIKVVNWSRDVKNADLASQTVEFEAMYSIADAQMIGAILTNTQTTY